VKVREIKARRKPSEQSPQRKENKTSRAQARNKQYKNSWCQGIKTKKNRGFTIYGGEKTRATNQRLAGQLTAKIGKKKKNPLNGKKQTEVGGGLEQKVEAQCSRKNSEK